MELEVKRAEIYLIRLDPIKGHEIRKTRPCMIVSPDEMNRHISTVIVAPLTTTKRSYPTRVNCKFGGKQAQVVLDQIRTIDKSRLIKRLGKIESRIQHDVFSILTEMFSQ